MAELELTSDLLSCSPVFSPVFHADQEVVCYSVGGKKSFGSDNFKSKSNMESSFRVKDELLNRHHRHSGVV